MRKDRIEAMRAEHLHGIVCADATEAHAPTLDEIGMALERLRHEERAQELEVKRYG